jgi:hypothetical protein
MTASASARAALSAAPSAGLLRSVAPD